MVQRSRFTERVLIQGNLHRTWISYIAVNIVRLLDGKKRHIYAQDKITISSDTSYSSSWCFLFSMRIFGYGMEKLVLYSGALFSFSTFCQMFSGKLIVFLEHLLIVYEILTHIRRFLKLNTWRLRLRNIWWLWKIPCFDLCMFIWIIRNILSFILYTTSVWIGTKIFSYVLF